MTAPNSLVDTVPSPSLSNIMKVSLKKSSSSSLILIEYFSAGDMRAEQVLQLRQRWQAVLTVFCGRDGAPSPFLSLHIGHGFSAAVILPAALTRLDWAAGRPDDLGLRGNSGENPKPHSQIKLIAGIIY